MNLYTDSTDKTPSDLPMQIAFTVQSDSDTPIATLYGYEATPTHRMEFFKRGDPITFLFSTIGVVIGGACFPVDVMPLWLQKVAWLIPIPHSLDALRLALLQNHSLSMVAKPVLILGFMGIILFPVSLKMFSLAVLKGRRDGTLMQYCIDVMPVVDVLSENPPWWSMS